MFAQRTHTQSLSSVVYVESRKEWKTSQKKKSKCLNSVPVLKVGLDYSQSKSCIKKEDCGRITRRSDVTCVSTRQIVDPGTELLNRHSFDHLLRFLCLSDMNHSRFPRQTKRLRVPVGLLRRSTDGAKSQTSLRPTSTTTMVEWRMVIPLEQM